MGTVAPALFRLVDYLLCLGAHVRMFTMPCMWGSEDSLEELLLSFYLEFRILNSGYQAWQVALLPTDLLFWPCSSSLIMSPDATEE